MRDMIKTPLKTLAATALIGTSLAFTPAAQAQMAPEAPAAQAPMGSLNDAQKAEMKSWPEDKQAAYKAWPAETQSYYWTLSDERQDMFWRLKDADKVALSQMTPERQTAAWEAIETSLAG
jgi:hypothetical protein